MRKQQREAILALLEETYMGTETALNYSTPFELLVAVIMSAQCTDERVNKITARISRNIILLKNGRTFSGTAGRRDS